MKILALSDIHGRTNDFGDILNPSPSQTHKASDIDMVIVAGDLTNLGIHRPKEMSDVSTLLRALTERFGSVYYILGNHDIGVPRKYYDRRDKGKQCFSVENGLWHHREWGITGINFSPCFDIPEMKTQWCCMTDDPEIDKAAFKNLPLARIVVSHCPPYQILDKVSEGTHIGSPGLRAYIEDFQPSLVVCGHVHEDWGHEKLGHTTIVNTAEHASIIKLDNEGNLKSVEIWD
jgi:Icc-related predicted phosphoesterase